VRSPEPTPCHSLRSTVSGVAPRVERPTNWKLTVGVLGLIVALTAVALILFVFGGYTPTTIAYVQNDTGATVRLDNCAEIPITVAPGVRERLEPFEDASRAACTVFYGDKAEGTPSGCLPLPSSHGHTISQAVVRVSSMRRTGRAGCGR
jgi:hypothetical protein